MVGRVLDAVDLDNAPAGQAAGAPKQADLVIGQPTLLSGIGVIRNHEVTPRQCRLDVDVGGGGRFPRSMNRFAGSQQRLRWNAGPVGAFATHELSFDDGDPQAAVGQGAGAVLARRAPAQHNHVVLAAHVGSSLPARSCTM